MPGLHVTDRQVRRFMTSRREGHTQAVAAAQAGFSERTGRRIEAGPTLPSQKPPRTYRTRADPFADVWREELVPLLEAVPYIRAPSLLEELDRRHPGRFGEGVLRSLQRRVAHWRATEGPERELIFRQEHPPGRQALSDFTDGSKLGVTLAGRPFPHLLYHFWLAYSGWRSLKAICGGESFTALTEGLQDALWQLGGVPREHRTDRLSAAYRNLATRDDEAEAYAAFCRHYGLEPTRNNAGLAHENGSVEAAHGHLKLGLSEALELRGSKDFADLAAYQAFLQDYALRRNAAVRDALAVERTALAPLPTYRTSDYSVASAGVTRFGTISVRNVLYTVPSRLVGCRLTVHVYDDRLVCHLGLTPVLTLARRHFKRGGPLLRVVDYRHLVHALVRKPQAFRHSVFREDLFPRTAFRRAWDVLDAGLDPRQACRVDVGLLHLAATHACEGQLADHLDAVIDAGRLPDLDTARAAVAPRASSTPLVHVSAPDPAAYDHLLPSLSVTPDPTP